MMKTNKYRVSVIIPNYNRKRDLEWLLPSIANQTFNDYEGIIVDDASPDRSAVEYIKDFIKDRTNMRLVENTENVGFIKTCNSGIKLSNSDYVCILTNDTEVATNFIERNVEILDEYLSIGVLSCIIVDRDGIIWFSGGSIKEGIPENLRDDFQGVRSVDFVAGTAAFYRRAVFERIGLLNEDFVMYHEDVEFGLRVNHLTDYRTCMFGEKLVKHNIGPARLVTYKVVYYLHRNLILLLRKYSPRSIPRGLLHNLGEITQHLRIAVSTLSPRYFLYALYMSAGTLAGLVRRQRG